MPVTTLDPTSALLVIDRQKGLLGVPTLHPIARIFPRIAETGSTADVLALLAERGA